MAFALLLFLALLLVGRSELGVKGIAVCVAAFRCRGRHLRIRCSGGIDGGGSSPVRYRADFLHIQG